MDPLSALGVAAGVVQFLQFSSAILNSTVKIYQSSQGISDQSQHLSEIYTKLSQLSSGLQTEVLSHESTENASQFVQSCSSAVIQLGKDCKTDCDRLLDIISKLQLCPSSGRWWKSFRNALKEHLKSDEISYLQKRIENYETTIMMHLCTLSRYYSLSHFMA